MRTCIVTGASSGIGRATAIELSKEKHYDNIVLVGRDEKRLEQTLALMNNEGTTIVILGYDLSEVDGIPSLVQGIYDRFRSIDCLLNIAGYTEPTSIFETSIENLQRTYTVNVFAPLILIRECAKYMKLNCGAPKILNIASTAGMTSRPGWVSYASSKASVISFSSTLSDELSEYGIKVYCISPGRCATNLRRILAPEEDPSTIMQPEAVAGVILSLLRDSEHYLDGQNIVVRQKV